jgi:O-antigen/teichoic acid export membrane protein
MDVFKRIADSFSVEFLTGIGWNLSGQVVTRIDNMLTAVIVARNVSLSEFAFYSYFIGVYAFLVTSSSLAIRISNNRYTANNSLMHKEIIPLIASFLLALFSFLLVISIATLYHPKIGVKLDSTFIGIIALGISSEVLFLGIYGILEGKIMYAIVNKFTLMMSICRLIIISLLSHSFGIKVLMTFHGLISIFMLITVLFYFIWIHNINWEIKRTLFFAKQSFQIIKSAPPIFISSLVPGLFLTAVLTHGVANDPEDVGQFNISYQLRNLSIYVPLVVVNMYQSFSLRIVNFEKKLRKLSMGIVFLAICVLFVLSYVITNIYGIQYERSGLLLRVLLPITFLSVHNEISRQSWIKNSNSQKLLLIPLASYSLGYLIFMLVTASMMLKLVLFVAITEVIYFALKKV